MGTRKAFMKRGSLHEGLGKPSSKGEAFMRDPGALMKKRSLHEGPLPS
jgi:hypothetical protein